MHYIEILDTVTNTWSRTSHSFSTRLCARNTMGRSFPHEVLAQRMDGIERVRVVGPEPEVNEAADVLHSITSLS